MTPRPGTDGTLPAARQHLDNAISQLIDPKPHAVTRDTGHQTITWLDPLYTQLCDTIDGQKSAGKAGGNSGAPIWADALDLRDQIDHQVRDWHPEWPEPDVLHPEPTTVTRLRNLNDRTWSVEQTAEVTTIAATIEAFTQAIRDKLTPEPAIYLMAPGRNAGAAACTACGTTWVYRRDPSDNNRPIRQPALKVTATGCHCQHCRTTWEPGALRMLAAALGYPLPDGVLE